MVVVLHCGRLSPAFRTSSAHQLLSSLLFSLLLFLRTLKQPLDLQQDVQRGAPFSIPLIVPSTTPTLVGQVRVIPLDSFHFLYLERIILTSSPERCLASPSLTSNSNRKHGSQTRPLQNESRYTSDNVMTSGEQATSMQRATTTTLREGRLIQAIS